MRPSYEVLEKLMQEHDERPADVSRATGVGQSTFSDWKRGKSFPKVDKLMKIASHYNTTVDVFMARPAAVEG